MTTKRQPYEIKKISTTDVNLKKYRNQKNVIRQTGDSVLNYGKIWIMTDMDPDGSHIQCLLLQFFSHWPDLFSQGRIRRLQTPLFVARKANKQNLYFYSFDEYEENKSKLHGYDIKYMKGLGSLLKEDYDNAINQPKEIIISLDGVYESSLEKAFGDDSQLRKNWLLEEQSDGQG